jgi:two-component system chemotaxis sensor kinase CheA
MAGFDISMYREMFLEEAEELFESADNLLLEAENNGTLDDEQMNQLFRDVHTLKGSGASVELTYFAEFTHDVENMMDQLRNHKIEFQLEMATTLIDCLDVMKEILSLEADGSLERPKFDEMTRELLIEVRAYISGEAPAASSQDSQSASSDSNDSKEHAKPTIDKATVGSETGNGDTASSSSSNDAFDTFNQKAVAGQVEDDEKKNIGFFDEQLNAQVSGAFGFFKEELQKEFGFLDNEKSKESFVKESVADQDHDDFGFFFDDEESEASSQDNNQNQNNDNKPQEEKAKTQTKPKTQNNVNTESKVSESKPAESKSEPKPALKKATASSGAGSRAAKETDAESQKAVSKSSAANNIRVNLDKIDALMNNVGDLVITNAMLGQYANTLEDDKIKNSVIERLELLDRHIREMQDSIMNIRMVPMESIYSKFPKVIRDLSKRLGKKVDFRHYGDNVEIDKAMIEGLTDPLMHIIRNSMDHGLEKPEDRIAAGKDEKGFVSISAEQSNGQMIITIEDDGQGVNVDRVVEKALDSGNIDENQLANMSTNDKAMLIFGAGLSTAEEISDISGRGVGMDVVKTNINKLGGVIRLETEPGQGTKIVIVLPLTLAILDGLDIAVGDIKFILPLSTIVESLQPKQNMIKRIGDGSQELLMLREEFIPIVRIHKLFNIRPQYEDLEDGMLIVVKSGNLKVAIFIDEFLQQHQVVVKPIDKNFRSVEGIGAATVRGDGSIGLILDVMGIVDAQKKIDQAAGRSMVV